jgi:hypothetical protein
MKQICRAAVAAAVVLCAPAHAETHALIMAIGNYGMPGATPLKGVVHDVASAQEIARRLGVRDTNMTVLRDGQLTYEGMNGAFEQLRERIAPNDDVFIYYSGHGGRQPVSDPDERCAESLVTYDGQAFVDTEVEAKLKGLSAKANRLVVLLDACHSGGVTTRSKGDGRFASKYIARSGGGEACMRPVNMLKRNIQSRGPGSGAQNYVYIAAARDNEVSLDEAAGGGVATQAWRDCVTGGARDLDGSGAISAEEVQACAQQIIDKKLANVQGFTAHHISITGNSRAVMSFAQPVAAAGVAAVAAPTVSPASTLADIHAQRDDRRTVTLSSPTKLKIGRDRFQLQVSSSHPGYLYLLMAGSDGKSFDMLFPNKLDAANEIQAGQTVRLPRAEWEVTAGGPPGVSQVLAIVTDAPRDFSKLDMKPAGPFSVLDASPIAAKDIVLVSTSAPAAAAPECVDPLSRRNLSVQKRCSNAYGAALIAVEEMQ